MLPKSPVDKRAKAALIVTGPALNTILENPENDDFKKDFISITDLCKVVICCRVSPKQKQEVVTAVRNSHEGICTLAIGDGANDVQMITAAHVGIGIRGVEGQ